MNISKKIMEAPIRVARPVNKAAFFSLIPSGHFSS